MVEAGQNQAVADLEDTQGRRPSPRTEPRVLHRIDPRLVHSTLLEAWVPYVGARHVVVADASVAEDTRRRIIFQMSARDVGGTHFAAEVDVPRVLDALPSDESIIVVYACLEGFLSALEAGMKCDRVVVGHLPDGEDRRRLHPSVYVGEEELAWVERIQSRSVDVVVRPLPTDKPLGIRRGDDLRPVLTSEPPLPSELSPTSEEEQEAVAVVSAPPTESQPTFLEGEVTVVNERGLHLRAAHHLAQCAGQFQSSTEVGWPGQMVNAKSLLGITTLGAAQGTSVKLRVEGMDAGEAYRAIEALFADGFHEGPG